jgi:ribosomal protein S16
MKEFIKKIISFHVIALIAIVIIVLLVNFVVKSKASFKINEQKSTLILGHSHSACSLNDSIVKNSINLSGSGESYFYNYQKAKQLLVDNDHIKTIFIEFTNNQVDSVMDDWIWSYEKMSYFLPFYSPFMEREEFELLFKNNSTDLMSSYSVATRKNLFRIIKNDYSYIDELGGYDPTKLSKIDEMIENDRVKPIISASHTLSEKNIDYLRKMVDLFKANKIDVFLIRSPQHPIYPDTSNEKVFRSVLTNQFNDVPFLDFDAMDFPNSHYLDPQHLNYEGAKDFSILFNSLIQNGLLKSSNKQQRIDSAIRKFNAENPVK